MKITTNLEKNLKDVVGLPITKGNESKEVFGTVIEYNPETGETVMEVDEEKLKELKWMPIAGKTIGVSSTKNETCKHENYRAGHSPYVACICNDCGEEI